MFWKFVLFMTLVFSLASPAGAQRLPPAGDQLGPSYMQFDTLTAGRLEPYMSDPGYIRPIVCGPETLNYGKCYRWEPVKAGEAPLCLRARKNLIMVHAAGKASTHPVETPFILLTGERDADRILITVEDLKDAKENHGWLRTRRVTPIPCHEPGRLSQAEIFDVLPVPEFLNAGWTERHIHNCVMAEDKLQTSPYAADDWDYFCMGNKTHETAKYSLVVYGKALISLGAKEYGMKMDPPQKFLLEHAPSSDGYCMSIISLDTASLEDTAAYYERNKLEPDMPGQVANMLAVERIGCKTPWGYTPAKASDLAKP